ncbi:MAG: sigma-70 family RNA polymerase sigma factor, partial [Granulosicoccus sp.]
AFQSIDGFKGASTVSTWLHRILINCCLMKLRKSKTAVEVSIDSLLPSFLEDGHRANTKPAWPDEFAEKGELVNMVSDCIQKLPDNYRTVLMLRDIDGFTGDETANLLDISPNLVKVRLHRARLALRETIDPEMRSVL